MSGPREQLKGSVKELNISICFFFRPSLNGVLFLMFLFTLGREVSDFSVLKYY